LLVRSRICRIKEFSEWVEVTFWKFFNSGNSDSDWFCQDPPEEMKREMAVFLKFR
jgi:hypothetical protein